MNSTRVTKTTSIWLAIVTTACGSGPLGSTRFETRPSMSIRTTAVALNPADPTQAAIGRFRYAGGIEITSTGSPGLHELSDMEIQRDGRLVAVSDEGYLFNARLVLDGTGQLSGLADAQVTRLVDEQGRPVRGAVNSDAEGLTTLPNGDRLVSFERDHRIWLYPAAGGPPRPAPKPDAPLPDNEGMEALSAYPAAGPNAYLVGSEAGTVWLCDLSTACRETALGRMVPAGLSLTALASFGDEGDLAMLCRAYTPAQGNRIVVRLIASANKDGGRLLDELAMAAPLTRDNFEAIAIVSRPADGIRLYLLSDDNGSRTQRTYLLAFDWNPP
ncbi:MAG TPA: esterase-like activity of phytase family protein [Vicinamibacterales bacterium]